MEVSCPSCQITRSLRFTLVLCILSGSFGYSVYFAALVFTVFWPSQHLLHKQCFSVFPSPFSLWIFFPWHQSKSSLPFAFVQLTATLAHFPAPAFWAKLSPPPPQPHWCWDKSSSTSHNVQTCLVIPFASQPSFPHAWAGLAPYFTGYFRQWSHWERRQILVVGKRLD